MAELELPYHRMADLQHTYSDSVLAVNAKCDSTIHRLKEEKKDKAARERNMSDEVSRLKVELGSVRSELESVQSDLKSTQEEVKA